MTDANPFAALLDGVPRLWLQFGPMGEVESVSNEVLPAHSEWVRLSDVLDALAAEKAKVAKLVDLLCLADEAIMREHGCFPMDRTNERQIFLNDACTAIRKITGDDYTERKRRARAAITEAQQ